MVLRRIKQEWTTFLTCGLTDRSESNRIPRFLKIACFRHRPAQIDSVSPQFHWMCVRSASALPWQLTRTKRPLGALSVWTCDHFPSHILHGDGDCRDCRVVRCPHASCMCIAFAARLLIFSAPTKTDQRSHTARRRRTSNTRQRRRNTSAQEAHRCFWRDAHSSLRN